MDVPALIESVWVLLLGPGGGRIVSLFFWTSALLLMLLRSASASWNQFLRYGKVTSRRERSEIKRSSSSSSASLSSSSSSSPRLRLLAASGWSRECCGVEGVSLPHASTWASFHVWTFAVVMGVGGWNALRGSRETMSMNGVLFGLHALRRCFEHVFVHRSTPHRRMHWFHVLSGARIRLSPLCFSFFYSWRCIQEDGWDHERSRWRLRCLNRCPWVWMCDVLSSSGGRVNSLLSLWLDRLCVLHIRSLDSFHLFSRV